MAFTRKLLKSMEIDGEKIDQIIEAHLEVVEELKNEVSTLKEKADKLDGVQRELDELKATAENGNTSEEYEKLKQEFEDYKAEIEQKATAETKRSAYKKLLEEAGVSAKRIDTVLKASGDVVNGLEFDEEGKVKDSAKLAEDIKTEWADFIQATNTEGAKPSTPPANNGGGMTREQIRAIKDPGERQQAMIANPEMFGLPT